MYGGMLTLPSQGSVQRELGLIHLGDLAWVQAALSLFSLSLLVNSIVGQFPEQLRAIS